MIVTGGVGCIGSHAYKASYKVGYTPFAVMHFAAFSQVGESVDGQDSRKGAEYRVARASRPLGWRS